MLADALDGERLVTFALRPARGGVARSRAGRLPWPTTRSCAIGERLRARPAGRRAGPVRQPRVDAARRRRFAADAPVLATGTAAVAAFEQAVDEWLGLTAAALVGIGARALEIGVDYVKEREAWGEPIGSFQGISHRLADTAAAVDGARLLALRSGVGGRRQAGAGG